MNELRQELVARNLSSKGLKSQLVARLSKAIKSEQAKEEGRQDEAEENEKESSPIPKEEAKEDKKSKDSKEVSHETDIVIVNQESYNLIFFSQKFGIFNIIKNC